MSSVVISGDTSGAITLAAPAVAGTNTITLPASTGTVVVGSTAVSATGQIPFSTDGSSYTPTAKIVSGTAVASTSGTSIDFTGIPSWVKRITVMYTSLQISGSSNVLFQLGTSGGAVTTGYLCSGSYTGATSGASNYTTGFGINSAGSSNVLHGKIVFDLFNVSTNTWTANGVCGLSNTPFTQSTSGSKALSGTLDRVRITTVNGTDTFTAGSINILYE